MATVLYNCKKCKVGKRVEYAFGSQRNGFYRVDASNKPIMSGIYIQACGGGKPTVYGGDIEMGVCPSCHKMMDYGVLNAHVVPEHKCDARCMASRGPSCECSCGGANHGASWA